MKIAVDMDGVLADFNVSFARLMNRIDPTAKFDILSAEWPSKWDWWDHVDQTIVDKAWTEVRNSGVFWKSLFPYINAWEDIKKLASMRDIADIYFLTVRPGVTAKAETEEWLYGHGFVNATVVICDNKVKFCDSCKIDLIIDDAPHNLIGAPEHTTQALFKRPYNRNYWNTLDLTVETVREAIDRAM